jgi:membrane protease subunit HflK
VSELHHDEPIDAGSAALDEAVALAFRVLKGLMLVLVVLFAFSGFYSVQPNEVAFVSWLGRLSDDPHESGGHLTAPLISRVVRVDLRAREGLHESFDVMRTEEELLDGRLHARQGGLDPANDGYLVTGDANLVHVAFASQVKVDRPKAFLTGALDPEALVDVLVERAAVRAAARSTVDRLLGAGKGDFTDEIAKELQDALNDDQVAAGLEVEGIELERPLTPSGQVQDAFVSVSEAVQQGDQLSTRSRSKAARTVSDAQTEAARIVSQARSEAERIRVDAEADRQVFHSLRDEWVSDPAGLRQRLLVEALVDSLDRVDEVFLVTDGDLRLRIQRDAKARVSDLARRAKEATRSGY